MERVGIVMFIVTAKFTKKRLIALVILAGLFLCGLILLLSGGRDEDGRGGDGQAVLENPEAKAVSARPSGNNIKTNEDRIAYLGAYGWEVSADPVEYQEVVIPSEFDDVLEHYNELQKQQGFDLSKYKGKRLMRYTYEIQNYPTGETGVQAVLFLYKNKVVGGDIHSLPLDGFMHGLAREKAVELTPDLPEDTREE